MIKIDDHFNVSGGIESSNKCKGKGSERKRSLKEGSLGQRQDVNRLQPLAFKRNSTFLMQNVSSGAVTDAIQTTPPG